MSLNTGTPPFSPQLHTHTHRVPNPSINIYMGGGWGGGLAPHQNWWRFFSVDGSRTVDFAFCFVSPSIDDVYYGPSNANAHFLFPAIGCPRASLNATGGVSTERRGHRGTCPAECNWNRIDRSSCVVGYRHQGLSDCLSIVNEPPLSA